MLMIRRVVGDSMMPAFSHGQLVVGSRFYWRLRPGEVVIIRHQMKEKVKRIHRMEAGGLYVIGDNKQASTDSRDFGLIPFSSVAAKVVWPLNGRSDSCL